MAHTNKLLQPVFASILSLLIVMIMAGCAKDESSKCGLNPPVWLQGNWIDSYGLVEWTITDGNLIMSAVSVSLDFCEEITGPTNTCNCKQWIEEINTSTRYKIRLDTDLGVSFEKADFVLISENSMREDNLIFTR